KDLRDSITNPGFFLLIIGLLISRHITIKSLFHKRRQVSCNFLFSSPEQKWLYQFLEFKLLFLITLSGNRLHKAALKEGKRTKQTFVNQVHLCPKVCQRVFYRSTRQTKSVARLYLLDSIIDLGAGILNILAFIEDKVMETTMFKQFDIISQYAIGCQNHMIVIENPAYTLGS